MKRKRNHIRGRRIIGRNCDRMSQVRDIFGEEARRVAYQHVIQTDLHRREQVMFQFRHVYGLMDN